MSAEEIRTLNDWFRRSFSGGKVMMTTGIVALSAVTKAKLLDEVRAFDNSTADNDPHGEHDFGSFEVEGYKMIFWKIDYYDAAMELGSEDPSDPGKTTRVLTIMLASEY
jgi:hypothetical protein